MPKELEEVKARLGFNVEITHIGDDLSKDGKNWVEGLSYNDQIGYSLVMSGGFIRQSFQIKMANCPNATVRKYQEKYRLPEFTVAPVISDPVTYFNDPRNRESFSISRELNFTSIEKIPSLTQSCIDKIKSWSLIDYYRQNLSNSIFENGRFTNPPIKECADLKNILPGLNLFFTDELCQESKSARIRIVAGKECEMILGDSGNVAFLKNVVIRPIARFFVKGPKTTQEIDAEQKARDQVGVRGKQVIGNVDSLISVINGLKSTLSTAQKRLLLDPLVSKRQELRSKFYRGVNSIPNFYSNLDAVAVIDEVEKEYLDLKFKLEDLVKLSQLNRTVVCSRGTVRKSYVVSDPKFKCPKGFKRV